MTNTPYIPHPADTGDIELSDELLELREQIAKNVHEVWAQARLDEGYTYGSMRDDIKKTHPGLVPYEQLSEAEKDYDRRTALGTLRLIQKAGFTISRLDKD